MRKPILVECDLEMRQGFALLIFVFLTPGPQQLDDAAVLGRLQNGAVPLAGFIPRCVTDKCPWH